MQPAQVRKSALDLAVEIHQSAVKHYVRSCRSLPVAYTIPLDETLDLVASSMARYVFSYRVLNSFLQPILGVTMNWGYLVAWSNLTDEDTPVVPIFFAGLIWYITLS